MRADRRRWADSSRSNSSLGCRVLASPAANGWAWPMMLLEESSWTGSFCAGPSRDFRHRRRGARRCAFPQFNRIRSSEPMVMPVLRSRPFRKEVCLTAHLRRGRIVQASAVLYWTREILHCRPALPQWRSALRALLGIPGVVHMAFVHIYFLIGFAIAYSAAAMGIRFFFEAARGRVLDQ